MGNSQGCPKRLLRLKWIQSKNRLWEGSGQLEMLRALALQVMKRLLILMIKIIRIDNGRGGNVELSLEFAGSSQ